jgi:hypothetical protein
LITDPDPALFINGFQDSENYVQSDAHSLTRFKWKQYFSISTVL